MIDEDGLSTFDHSAHPAVDRRDLNNPLDHLDCAAALIDNHGEGCSLDDGREHRRVDRKVRYASVLDLEQHGAKVLDHTGESARLLSRGHAKFAVRCDDDIISTTDKRRPTGRPR